MNYSTSRKKSTTINLTTKTIQSKMLLIELFCLIFLLISSYSNMNKFLPTVMAKNETPLECLVLKNLVTNRLSRSLIENRHRMSENEAEARNMKNLIRLHYNCLLHDDRIRFKKRG
uniref:Uncharacterized protein LOC113799855 n=1 Tax=Dermatophagoides pteronyssinus TaxID=6956 RepID=A0A6P6YN62_DERPT|nr:uncharacterized protein LOC113799855 [Dermatophagoides pteronyssinus]